MPASGGRIKCAEIFFKAATMQREYNCLLCHLRFDQYLGYADHFPACFGNRPMGLSGRAAAQDSADSLHANNAKLMHYSLGATPECSIKPEITYDDPLQMYDPVKVEQIRMELEEAVQPVTANAPANPRIASAKPHTVTALPTNKIPYQKQLNFLSTSCKENNEFSNLQLQQLRLTQGSHTPLTCALCGHEAGTRGAMFRHMTIKHRPIECPECGRQFKHVMTLKSHVRAAHNRPDPNRPAQIYVPVVLKPYKCDMCSMTFKTASLRYKHQRTHTGERPYTCEFCGRNFAQHGALQNHRNLHTGEAPHKCRHCAESFRSGATRRQHEKKVHMVR